MNLDFVKNLTQSCKTGVGFDQQCKTEEDCRYWGFGKDGKGNTCNLYTKKCIKLRKVEINKMVFMIVTMMVGSVNYHGKYVDAEKVCRLNGFVAISSTIMENLTNMKKCVSLKIIKKYHKTNKIKTVDKIC